MADGTILAIFPNSYGKLRPFGPGLPLFFSIDEDVKNILLWEFDNVSHAVTRISNRSNLGRYRLPSD